MAASFELSCTHQNGADNMNASGTGDDTAAGRLAHLTDVVAAVHGLDDHESSTCSQLRGFCPRGGGPSTGSLSENRRGIVFAIPQGKWLWVTELREGRGRVNVNLRDGFFRRNRSQDLLLRSRCFTAHICPICALVSRKNATIEKKLTDGDFWLHLNSVAIL